MKIFSFLVMSLMATTAWGSTIFSATGARSADATFTFTSGVLTLTLQDDTANPADSSYLLTGITFNLTSGSFANNVGTQTAIVATERTLSGSGTHNYSDVPYTSTGNPATTFWDLTNTGNTFNLLFHGASNAIIGAPGPGDIYTGNSSIFTTSHNPFYAGAPVWTISIPGVTSLENVSGVTFYFGTQREYSVPASATTPEPFSLGLVGGSLIGLGLLKRVSRS